MKESANQAELSNLHLQINSVLIHLGDHLNYLYHLLSGGNLGTGINIALSESERYKIIQTKLNTTLGPASQHVIRHRFQMLGEDILCLIMEVPIPTEIKSLAMIQVYPFPTIRKNSLWVPNIISKYFLHFVGGFFVEADGITFLKCLQDGFCFGPVPLQYADKDSGCQIRQYFGEETNDCSFKRIMRRRFLLHTGETLIYSLLDTMSLRLFCQNTENDAAKRLKGRGKIKIPVGCQARTNKAVFSISHPKKIFIETNFSLGKPLSIPPSTIIESRSGEAEIELIPLPDMNMELKGKSHLRHNSGHMGLIIMLSCIIFLLFIIVLATMVLSNHQKVVTQV